MLVTEPEDAISGFIAAWNADDDEERLRLLQAACAADAVFVSPQGVTCGCAPMSTSIGAFRRAFPRARVVAGPADAHHGYTRFRWATVWNDGRPDLRGDDYAALDEASRIRELTSFDGRSLDPESVQPRPPAPPGSAGCT